MAFTGWLYAEPLVETAKWETTPHVFQQTDLKWAPHHYMSPNMQTLEKKPNGSYQVNIYYINMYIEI